MKPRCRRSTSAVLALVVATALSACSGSGGAARTLNGHVIVTEVNAGDVHFPTDGASLRGASVDHAPKGGPCTTSQGFADIAEGTNVTVKNEKGTIIATGDLSRNRRVGIELARGKPLREVLASLGHVAEGVRSAKEVMSLARKKGVDMPVSEAVDAVLEGTLTPLAAVEQLLSRDPKREA